MLSGCTEEEKRAFERIIFQSLVEEGKCKVGLGQNCSNKSGVSVEFETPTPVGECRFDSDCSSLCEGSMFWKRGCDARTNMCVKTFDTDCGAQTTDFGSYRFPQLCAATGCTNDTASIHAEKEELVALANNYSYAMQRTTELRLLANKNCPNGLAEVTNSLIIDTAVTSSSLPTSVVSVYSDTTKQAIQTIGDAANPSGQMSAEEFISLNCNSMRALDTDFALISKKRDKAMEDAQLFAGQ